MAVLLVSASGAPVFETLVTALNLASEATVILLVKYLCDRAIRCNWNQAASR